MTILNSILATLVLGFSILIWYYRDIAVTYQYRMETYQSQVEAMKKEATAMTQRFEIARQQSLEEMRHVQDRSKEIMDTKIPPDCESAIKFGRDQAKRFASISR
jgi:uncharacterized membrane protein (DUF106 family)